MFNNEKRNAGRTIGTIVSYLPPKVEGYRCGLFVLPPDVSFHLSFCPQQKLGNQMMEFHETYTEYIY